MNEQIERVQAMEAILNAQIEDIKNIENALSRFLERADEYEKLRRYYGSNEMDADLSYEAEGGLEGIPRGVLSEDAVYNMMGARYALGLQMLAGAQKIFEQF
ncbi:Uncharacterised protein [Aedoeadaptatus ivorii]|uniref:DUF4298 domain-containing protein n=1 Tax=Aedoeadaptatus ivorii TaxID=54006 RepID=A0A3S4YLM0_9FIRM|nr:DUF4298 domain-containing protein [Peptoniphilus ivorii]MDQ0508693.1 hypothetical protein [Peptoniphilus ivorii]VEJ36180.1 Uncharacterised protein [Peptoniphilus ivorii]